MPLQNDQISTAARWPLLALSVLIPVLAYAGFKVHDAVAETGRYQQNIRLTQVWLGRVLRYQLDEETGIRGYQATGDALYLDPYERAKAAMPLAFTFLQHDLNALAIDGAARVAADEQRQNARWLAEVGEPLRVPMSRPRMLATMRHGRNMVDRFRAADRTLQDLLNAAASAADGRTERAIANVSLFVFSALLALTAGAGIFTFSQARTLRRAFADRMLYENQKRIADALQTAFLNKNLPAAPNLGLHATYIPATREAQVGGDWYDAFELPDHRILFSIGDVAGHGLEAAIVMSRARQAIIAAALHENDPAKVLERANEAILLQDSRMVTAICGYIDPATLEVVYATAGHPPPIMARPGSASVFLPYEGLPMGIIATATYRTFVATASDGAVMVLYTDGVIEHKRDVIEGEQRLLEATRLAVLDDDPALAIQRYIFAAGPPTDDVAILTVRFKTTGGTPRVAAIGALQFNRLDLPGTQSAGETTVDPPIDGGARAADGLSARLGQLLAAPKPRTASPPADSRSPAKPSPSCAEHCR